MVIKKDWLRGSKADYTRFLESSMLMLTKKKEMEVDE